MIVDWVVAATIVGETAAGYARPLTACAPAPRVSLDSQ